MHNCSNEFFLNISNPAISKTPMKVEDSFSLFKTLFIFSINLEKFFSYNVLANDEISAFA